MQKQLTIRRKLAGSTAVFMLLLFVLGATAWITLGLVSAELNEAVNRTATKMDLVQGIAKRSQETLSDVRGAALSYANNDPGSAAANEKKLQAAYTRLGEMVRDVTPLLSPEGKPRMETVARNLALIQPLQAEYLELSKAGKPAEADALMREKLAPLQTSVEAETLAIVKLNRTVLAGSVQRAASIETSSHRTIAAVSLFTLLGAVVMLLRVREIQAALKMASQQLTDEAENISAAAEEVASSSNEVAQGASEQAASIDATASSTAQVHAMSRKNAENSLAMASLAEESQRRFAQTAQQLEEMVVSMAEIHQSSGQISKIIKVIDEIAFQTNILALNAAVEAARAGEAGAGFAVVADEVRTLAQRSAQAAQDTAQLIEDSIARSNAGKGKVDLVAQAIREIAGGAAKIKSMADEVNAGSAEQSRGLEQMGQAIDRMGEVTQATATSAGQSAAVADALNAEVDTLRDVIARLNAMVTQDGIAKTWHTQKSHGLKRSHADKMIGHAAPLGA